MQANIKNVGILKKTYLQNRQIVENLHKIILNYQKELNNLEEIAKKEVNLSENFLRVAQIYEKQKLALLLKAEAELARALEAEAGAMASGNPAAIASASALVAKATKEVYQAKKEYDEAKKNRINMEKRVELAKQAFNKAKQLNEESKKIFNVNFQYISQYNKNLFMRLNSAEVALSDYLSKEYQAALNEYINDNISKEELNKAYIEKIKYRKIRKSKLADKLGVKISKYGFPEFESKVSFFMSPEEFCKSREAHFRLSNRKLKQKMENSDKLIQEFTERQILQIKLGKTPEGYTWHHDGNPPPGRMQLVKTDIHDKIRHDGGYSLWVNREECNE